MNGTKPKFLEGVSLQESYYAQPNPYVNAQSCYVNLLDISRYARQQKKKLSELTVEEVKKFALGKANSQ